MHTDGVQTGFDFPEICYSVLAHKSFSFFADKALGSLVHKPVVDDQQSTQSDGQ